MRFKFIKFNIYQLTPFPQMSLSFTPDILPTPIPELSGKKLSEWGITKLHCHKYLGKMMFSKNCVFLPYPSGDKRALATTCVVHITNFYSYKGPRIKYRFSRVHCEALLVQVLSVVGHCFSRGPFSLTRHKSLPT